MNGTIGIGGLEPSVTDELGALVGFLDTVNDDLGHLADMGGGGGKAESLCQVHGGLSALELHVLVDLTVHLRGERPLLLRIREHARVIEALAIHEREHLGRFLIGLTGEADETGGADNHRGDLGAKLREEVGKLLGGAGTMHCLQDARVAVLHGDVDIGQDLGCVADGGDELVGHSFGLQVEDADPDMLGTDRLSDGDHELR